MVGPCGEKTSKLKKCPLFLDILKKFQDGFSTGLDYIGVLTMQL